MKAVVLVKNGKGNEAFEIQEMPKPSISTGEVLVKVNCFGLNYADVMARNGLYKDAPPMPSVLGYEVVGTIESLGAGITDFKVGDRVLGFTLFGAYAEYAKVDERTLAKLPESISDEVGTCLATQYCTAYVAAHNMGNIQEGEKVLVHAAAGGVGTAVVQLAKLKGCKVYGTAGSVAKMDYLQSIGVDVPINYRTHDFSEVINEKVDVIFDPIGGSSFSKDKKLINYGGRIICYGAAERSGGGLLKTLKFVWDFGFLHPIGLLMKSFGVIGLNMLRVAETNPLIIKRSMEKVIELTVQGELKPHVGATYKAQDIGEAHDFLESRKSIGKVVVKW